MRGISPMVRKGSAVNEMKTTYIRSFPVFAFALLFAAACQVQQAAKPLKPPQTQTETRTLPLNTSPQLKLVIDGATDQIGKTTTYDASYQKLEYPNGDVPIETGVCSDVIVRAFRQSGIDLQKDVHEDMKENFSAYPTRWGLKEPTPNIYNSRMPNPQTYFPLTTTSLAP